ncbi:MAG: type II toxin-antitoxin system Phd/YefM family antitoxin [Actinomycetota bacterium]
METAAARDLRNNTRQILKRVEAGQPVTITVSGRPVAQLVPLDTGITWMPRDEFVRRFADRQADPAMAQDLLEVVGNQTTDDLDA